MTKFKVFFSKNKFNIISWLVTIAIAAGMAFGAYAWKQSTTTVQALAPEPTSAPDQKQPNVPMPALGKSESALAISREILLKTNIPSDKPRYTIEEYRVVRGDSVFAIAEKFKLKPESVLWGNYDVMQDDPHSLKPGQVLKGHVRSVAAVAAQGDWMSSDVKVYQTLVLLDESVEDLKPDMSAEVTIMVDSAKESVLAVPLQAIVGGAESGPKRKVYIKTATGTDEREVELGAFNERMVEILSGIQEGDEVILNPKVLLGDKIKTREDAAAMGRSKDGMSYPGAEKKGKGDGKKGGPPAGMGGPPAGAGGGGGKGMGAPQK